MRTPFIPIVAVLIAGACSANDLPVAPAVPGTRPEAGPPPAGTNVSPTVTMAAPTPGVVGVPITVSATFTDPDVADTHTCSLDWQISAAPGTVTETGGAGSCAGSFTYQAPGIYKVVTAVIDNMGGTGMDSVMIDVAIAPPAPPPPPPPPPPPAQPPVPGTGLLFGEGRIAPPVGAGRRESAPVFEVAARNTRERGLKAAFALIVPGSRFRFQAVAADQFTVTGGLAELRGSGRVGERAQAYYLVRALDAKRAGVGRSDRIRIKIWNQGGVLYDSDPGSPDSAAPAAAVDRGGIVIRP